MQRNRAGTQAARDDEKNIRARILFSEEGRSVSGDRGERPGVPPRRVKDIELLARVQDGIGKKVDLQDASQCAVRTAHLEMAVARSRAPGHIEYVDREDTRVLVSTVDSEDARRIARMHGAVAAHPHIACDSAVSAQDTTSDINERLAQGAVVCGLTGSLGS